MLSKARIKFIKSLQIKKYRKQEQSFIVQGAKSVQELLHSDFETVLVAGTAQHLGNIRISSGIELIEASERELAQVGEFQTNESVLAVARMKEKTAQEIGAGEIVLVLDDIRDPGNLGTIIRTADWYGISYIIASAETADFYNPKVISATMGSFTRVNVHYTDLAAVLGSSPVPVYGAYLDGKDVHKENFSKGGLIMIGNEARGISAEHEKYVTNRITIPRYGKAESLNAAMAAGIICDVIRSSSR